MRPIQFLGLVAPVVFGICCAPITTRTVTFDPLSIKTSGPAEHFAEGQLDLTVALQNANPICASYQVKIGAQAYTPQPAISLTAGAPQSLAVIAPPTLQTCTGQTGPQLATCAVQNAQKVAQAVVALQTKVQGWQGNLAQVWMQCDLANASTSATLTAQVAALRNLAKTLGDSGLDKIVAAASEASLVAFDASRELRQEQSTTALQVVGAKSTAQIAKDKLDAVGKKGKPADVDKARLEYVKAQKVADDLQGQSDQLDKLATATSDWADQVTKFQSAVKPMLDSLRSDVEAALSLVSISPPAGAGATLLLTRQQFEPNQLVSVEVIETRRAAGKPVDKGGDRSLGSVSIAVLRPIWIDVSVGPAFTFQPIRGYGLDANNKIVQNEKSANIDGVVSLSGYVWGSRVLNGAPFRPGALLPRPMLGMSMRQPFSSLYFGAQFDPIQFLDISIGGRVYSATTLVGANVGDSAALDSSGKPISPTTASEAKVAGFVSISASTDLFSAWLKSLAK
jgi:hypothetical protein